MGDNNNNNGNNIIDSLLQGMDKVISSKTVVGESTRIGDTIILPLVDVTFGVGAGATSKGGESGGLTGKLSPSAVLVIKDGYTKLVNIKNQDMATKIIDLIPDLVDKISDMTGKKKKDIPSDEEAVEAAFPDINE